MVHSEATGGACVFRSAAAVNARLHAVDANVFPEPRAQRRARRRRRAGARAGRRRGEGGEGERRIPGGITFRGV